MNDIHSTINLLATGDIMLGGTLKKIVQEKGLDPIFAPVKEYFNNADIAFGNFEGPITDQTPNFENKVLLHQDRKVLAALKKAGYHVLSLANNHIMDFGDRGLSSTLSAFTEAGLQSTGAGKDLSEARKPAKFSIKGKQIAILGYISPTTELTHPIIYATETSGGLAKMDLSVVREDVQKSRDEGADIVILSLHWGEETCHYPLTEQIAQGHAMIDMGADIIIGHHSHILQGIEKYKKGLIIYSLGNFIFGGFTYPNGKEEHWAQRHKATAMVNCVITADNSIDYEVIPLRSGDNLIPKKLEGKEKRKVLDQIKNYSRKLTHPKYAQILALEVLKERIRIFIEKIYQRLF